MSRRRRVNTRPSWLDDPVKLEQIEVAAIIASELDDKIVKLFRKDRLYMAEASQGRTGNKTDSHRTCWCM